MNHQWRVFKSGKTYVIKRHHGTPLAEEYAVNGKAKRYRTKDGADAACATLNTTPGALPPHDPYRR